MATGNVPGALWLLIAVNQSIELLFVCLKLTLSSSFLHKGATKPMCIALVAAALDAHFGGGGCLAWGCDNPLVQGWSCFISV